MSRLSLVIVRHGNSFAAGEVVRRVGARTDIPLTQHGQAQADALGRYFAAEDWQFDQYRCSPLQRTQQTAAAILAHQQRAVPCVPDGEFLREIDHGPDENRAEADVIARIGAQALLDWDRLAIPPADWNVHADQRLAAWRQVFGDPAEEGHRRLLFVTSNGAARFALIAAASFGVGLPQDLKLATGSFGVIECDHGAPVGVPIWGQRP